jgi:hypothetical protein
MTNRTSRLQRHPSKAPRRRIRTFTALAWPMVGVLALVPMMDLATPSEARAGGFLEESKPKNINTPTYVEPAEREAVEGDGTAPLEAELSNAKLRVSEAIQNADAAEYNVTRARTRRYPRGEALAELQEGAVETKKERQEALQAFKATLEKARQGGVPAGLLMPYLDYSDWLDQQAAAAAAPKY